MAEIAQLALILVWAIAGIIFFVWLFFLVPADMAKARNRDPVAWVLVSLFFSPFAAIILLWLVGSRG